MFSISPGRLYTPPSHDSESNNTDHYRHQYRPLGGSTYQTSSVINKVDVTDFSVQRPNTNSRDELLYSFASQRTIVPLVVLQAFPGDVEVLEIPGLAIEVPELIVGRIFLRHRADQPGTHPIIGYKGQDRSNHCVPLAHGFPLVGIQIINFRWNNPYDLG